MKQVSALHSEHSLVRKSLQKRREREREHALHAFHKEKKESKTTEKHTHHHSQGWSPTNTGTGNNQKKKLKTGTKTWRTTPEKKEKATQLDVQGREYPDVTHQHASKLPKHGSSTLLVWKLVNLKSTLKLNCCICYGGYSLYIYAGHYQQCLGAPYIRKLSK